MLSRGWYFLWGAYMDLAVIFILSGIVFGGASAIVAVNKNRDGLGWFVLGFMFSLIALIVICALSPTQNSNSNAVKAGKVKSGKDFTSNPNDPERPWLG